jgi:probable HAF family extracellular repeat protein
MRRSQLAVAFRRFPLLAGGLAALSACTDRAPTGPSPSDLVASEARPVASTVRAIDLGTLGGISARAHAINKSGDIVGVSDPAVGAERATYWEKISATTWSIHQLPAAADQTQSGAAGINDAGVIDGWTYGGANGSRDVRWLSQGSAPETLLSPASDIGGINLAGQIVGSIPVAATAQFEATTHGFLWDNGVITDLGDLGGRQSQAFDINNSGDIVGFSRVTPLPAGRTRAVVWKGGLITELPMLPGGTSDAMARSINDAGVIVGESPNPTGQWHAVRWVPAAGEPSGYRIEDLGLGSSEASGINSFGEIVGYYSSRGSRRAFYWRQDRGKIDLPPLRNGANAQAHAINDAREIVGFGEYSSRSSDFHAIVWTGIQ